MRARVKEVAVPAARCRACGAPVADGEGERCCPACQGAYLVQLERLARAAALARSLCQGRMQVDDGLAMERLRDLWEALGEIEEERDCDFFCADCE